MLSSNAWLSDTIINADPRLFKDYSMQSDYHLFGLHYIYIPRVNRPLNSFVKSWNNHSLRTEHVHTPNQLFAAGALLSQGSTLCT